MLAASDGDALRAPQQWAHAAQGRHDHAQFEAVARGCEDQRSVLGRQFGRLQEEFREEGVARGGAAVCVGPMPTAAHGGPEGDGCSDEEDEGEEGADALFADVPEVLAGDVDSDADGAADPEAADQEGDVD